MAKPYDVVDIGPFLADVAKMRGVWMFRPYHTQSPKSAAAVEMNAMIRDMGRIWTLVPEGEIKKLEHVLASRSSSQPSEGVE